MSNEALDRKETFFDVLPQLQLGSSFAQVLTQLLSRQDQ
jgi:hypothetical protein